MVAFPVIVASCFVSLISLVIDFLSLIGLRKRICHTYYTCFSSLQHFKRHHGLSRDGPACIIGVITLSEVKYQRFLITVLLFFSVNRPSISPVMMWPFQALPISSRKTVRRSENMLISCCHSRTKEVDASFFRTSR